MAAMAVPMTTAPSYDLVANEHADEKPEDTHNDYRLRVLFEERKDSSWIIKRLYYGLNTGVHIIRAGIQRGNWG
jgi:hypothetical protein